MKRVRFGLFDFDPATRELRREGTPVHLQSQPAQILDLLLRNPGEIVTRQALRDSVWGEETFVDFDSGLNFCIAQVRSALGDSASSPRYVQTIPKQGYRFIAPVTMSGAVPATEPPRRVRRHVLMVLAAASAAIAVAVGAWLVRTRSEPIPIAVVRFQNDTGDKSFDSIASVLTDSVVGELATSTAQRFAVIGNAAELFRPVGLRDVLKIGTSLKVKYVMLGSLHPQRDGTGLFIQVIRIPDQRHVFVTRPITTPEELLKDHTVVAKRIVAGLSTRLLTSDAPATH